MYSVCYVLVDREKLEYYHEMIISICSLRRRNFKGDVYVLLDQETRDILEARKKDEYSQFDIKFCAVDVPASLPQKMRSRYIKTSMRKYINGDFLFVDTDTIIAEELPEVIDDHDVALVYETNCRLNELALWIRDYEIKWHRLCGYEELDLEKPYYNSGVMWVKDTEAAHRLFEEWHQKWLVYSKNGQGILIDQPGLNQANYEMGCVIHRLPNIYNLQVPSDPFPTNDLAEAKILHYFHQEENSTYMLTSKKVRMLDLMDPMIQQIIDAPKRAFVFGTLLHKDDDRDRILKSNHYYVLSRIYTKYQALFQFGERVIQYCLRADRKMKRTINAIKNQIGRSSEKK